ncbi:MAG: class I SAM-dependent methyltransferase [bacterium]|nr:class I SAM-dependent methyltransferase [bacterium]
MPIINLPELANRNLSPVPWVDVKYNFPWHDTEFSKRMLSEHLDPTHNLASRSPEVLRAQIDWIDETWLKPGKAKVVLDLACGPGLIANELARRGYTAKGFDVAPAAIEYARHTASNEALPATYSQRDLRTTGYGAGYDAVIFNYGIPNSFIRDDLVKIMTYVRESLNQGGVIILELNSIGYYRKNAGRTWHTVSDKGLFGEHPYLALREFIFDEPNNSAVEFHFVIDLENTRIREYSLCYQGYTSQNIGVLLDECGLKIIAECDSLTGETELKEPDMMVVVANRIEDEP